MQDSVKDYINMVKNQVRWKQSHRDIGNELQNHIEEQAESYMKEGVSQEEANQRAVQEMGDPVEIGSEFDRIYRPEFRWDMTIFIIFFSLGGIALHLAINLYLGMWINFRLAAVCFAAGAVLVRIGYKMDFTLFSKYPLLMYIVWVFCILTILILSPNVNLKRFIINGREFASLFLLYPVIFAGIVCKMRNHGIWGCIVCAVTYFIVLLLAAAGNGMHMFVTVSFACAPVMYYTIDKNWFGNKNLLKVLFAGALIAILIVFLKGARGEARLGALLSPHNDPTGSGYLNITARAFLQSANLLGMSDMGKAIDQWLPNLNTENMFIFIVYRFGLLAFLVLIGIIVLFLLKAIKLCQKQKSFYGKIFSLTIISVYCVQFAVYILNNMGFYMMSASPPFIKYTGMNYLINMFLYGILMSVFSCEKSFLGTGPIPEEQSDSKFIELENKRLIIDFNYFNRKV